MSIFVSQVLIWTWMLKHFVNSKTSDAEKFIKTYTFPFEHQKVQILNYIHHHYLVGGEWKYSKVIDDA